MSLSEFNEITSFLVDESIENVGEAFATSAVSLNLLENCLLNLIARYFTLERLIFSTEGLSDSSGDVGHVDDLAADKRAKLLGDL